MVAKNSPSLPQNIDPNLKRAIDKQAESIDIGSGLRGSPDERWIRIRDLVDMGLAKKLAKNAQALVSGVNLVSTVAPILDIPPAPEEFVVNGGLGIVFLNWKNARELYSNHAYTEIWRAETDNLSNAVLIQQDASSFGSVDRNATYGTTYYYWIRFVSLADIKGPYNSAVGTMGKLAEDPAILLDMLEGELTASQLHSALNSRIDLIDAPSTGLVAQSLANANNITNEANARLSLAQQLRGDYTGNDLTQLTTGLLKQETVTRELSINQLSSQMALLTAGSANQFDHAEIWYFDSGVEGWTGDGTPTIANTGWLRPANSASAYVVSPVVNINGGVYPQIRARIRKTGSPVWAGTINYDTVAHGDWDKNVSIAEPVFESGVANVTWNMPAPWPSATITQFSMRLSMIQDASNYFEIDWVAVGRPAPGASAAELFTEQLARISGDSANASDIAIANTAIAGKASQSSVDSLTSRVTTAEGTLTTQGTKLTQLDSKLGVNSIFPNPYFSPWDNGQYYPDGWDGWASTGASKHTGAYAYSGGAAIQFSTDTVNTSGIQSYVYNLPNVEYVDIEVCFTLVSGTLSGSGILFDWVNTSLTTFRSTIAFTNLYVSADILGKKIICTARVKRPSDFTGVFSYYRCVLTGNNSNAANGLGAMSTKVLVVDSLVATFADASANAIQSLDTRVTSAEGVNTSQASQITSLQNDVAGKASASALSALDSRVTSAEGVNTSQASAITQISARIPGGGNLAPNPDFRNNASGWYSVSDGTVSAVARNQSAPAWQPAGYNQIGCYMTGQTGSYHDIRSYYDTVTETMSVEPGKRYCFSANTANHRCDPQMIIVWYTESGAYIGTSEVNVTSSFGGDLLDYWPRNAVFGVAPANARKAGLILRGWRQSGQSEPYLWICRPMFSEVHADTTVAPPYESSVAGAYAAIQEEATVRASETGTIMASKVLKLDVNGRIAGWGAINTGIESIMEFAFDKVLFTSPGSSSLALAIDAGKVVIDGAFIKTATITDAAIGTLSVTKLFGDTANFVKLNVGTLVVDDIQGDINALAGVSNNIPFSLGNGKQTIIGSITLGARVNNRPFLTRFIVRGSATFTSGGTHQVLARFWAKNSPTLLQTHTLPNDADFVFTAIPNVMSFIKFLADGSPDPTPSDWSSITVGQICYLYANDSLVACFTIAAKTVVNDSVGPGTIKRGTMFTISNLQTFGDSFSWIGVGGNTLVANGISLRRYSALLYSSVVAPFVGYAYASGSGVTAYYTCIGYEEGAKLATGRQFFVSISSPITGTHSSSTVHATGER